MKINQIFNYTNFTAAKPITKAVTSEEVNENIKQKSQTNSHLRKSPYLTDVLSQNEDIKDEFVLQKINEKIKKAPITNMYQVLRLQDVVNTYDGKYSLYKDFESEKYDDYFFREAYEEEVNFNSEYNKTSKREMQKILNQEIAENKSEFAKEFNVAAKTEALIAYLSYYTDEDMEMASHLYKNYYLNTLPQDIQEKCLNIAEKFRTFVILPEKYEKRSLDLIEREFNNWVEASNGEAYTPYVLRLSPIKNNFLSGDAVGIADPLTGIIFLQDETGLYGAFRHEMMHLNDEFIIEEYLNPKNAQIEIKNPELFGWFSEELTKAGISEEEISEAFKCRAEFIAFAAEGHLDEYSDKFKKILIEYGTPEWFFNIAPIKK